MSAGCAGGSGGVKRTPDADFLRSYAELLGLATVAARGLGHTEDGNHDQHKALDEHMEECRQCHEELTEQMNSRSAWPAGGALFIDADRLLEELARTERDTSSPPRAD